MIWVKDMTGRFRERPHFEPGELDLDAEKMLSDFFIPKYGQIVIPIVTDELTLLIEKDTSDFDMFADLSTQGDDVEGMTDFFKDKKPVVKISKFLSEESSSENRLRTTLTHEYAHVKVHASLWMASQMKFDVCCIKGPCCKREIIINSPKTDWMEWQAGYISGALLMPITDIKEMVYNFFIKNNLYGSVDVASSLSEELVVRVMQRYEVSRDAARVRLSQLGFLAKTGPQKSLL